MQRPEVPRGASAGEDPRNLGEAVVRRWQETHKPVGTLPEIEEIEAGPVAEWTLVRRLQEIADGLDHRICNIGVAVPMAQSQIRAVAEDLKDALDSGRLAIPSPAPAPPATLDGLASLGRMCSEQGLELVIRKAAP